MSHAKWPPNGNLSQWILDQFPTEYRGYGIDVGASDGVSINTTYALEKSHNWMVLSVEPNPFFHPMLKAERTWVETCALSREPKESATLHVHVENPEAFTSLRPQVRPDMHPVKEMTWMQVKVAVKTVDQLLEKWQFPRLDLLSIDTEGTELDILKGCDLERWKPRVIVTECWDPVGPIDLYLEALGYKKTARNVHNDIFVLAS